MIHNGTYSLPTAGVNDKDKSRKPKKMNLRDLIWKLLKLYFRYGNLRVKTWVQYEGFVDLYEPQIERDNFVSIY